MNLTKPIDLYCERTSAEFWAEPLNAVSNLSFVLAGLFGLYLAMNLKKQDNEAFWTQLLSINAILVGVGSFLFHTFADSWSLVADVGPIMAFMGLFLTFSLYRLLGLSQLLTGIGVAIFFLMMGLLGTLFGDALNGSIGYFPAWGALATVGHFLRDKNWPIAKLFLVAMGVFAVSLILRSLDIVLCDSLIMGTHFLWHTLNGLLLAVLIYSTSKYSQDLYRS